MTDLTFTDERLEAGTFLAVAGDIDVQTAPQLRAHVEALDLQGVTLVLDLAAVGFVDSSGLGALLGLKKLQEGRGGSLQLARLSRPVHRILEITRMDHVFERAN